MDNCTVSIVTPTFYRPEEVKGLLENISAQSVLPLELILIDGAPTNEDATEKLVAEFKDDFPFLVKYFRRNGGTAVQRNHGIGAARGDFVAFVDDDVRLDENFLKRSLEIFEGDQEAKIGGVVGFRTNEQFDSDSSQRWRWYKRLGLLSTFEPGRYDFESGYPINTSMQPPFSGTRHVDFMTTACAVWRREVFDSGLRFDPFFQDYGVLEDAHLSLRAGRKWKLLQCGDAKCEELRSPKGRVNQRKIGYKCVANYYYVFRDIAGPLTFRHQLRFWRFQAFELFRIGISAVRRRRWGDVMDLVGRFEGMFSVALRAKRSVRDLESTSSG
ncbi:MAG: glycosyltransferase family 2 protein [Pyrinomonadaceae bacterium]